VPYKHIDCSDVRCAAGAFENTVQALYKYVVPKPREECSKYEQLTVSFAAGYIAGVFCAVVSHPADNLVSKLNAQKGATAGEIIKQMGYYALFTRGLGLRIIMIGTLTGLQVRRLFDFVMHTCHECSNLQRYAGDMHSNMLDNVVCVCLSVVILHAALPLHPQVGSVHVRSCCGVHGVLRL
jgi:hypothetical protein